jgi:uncharacterized membrane protein YfcA
VPVSTAALVAAFLVTLIAAIIQGAIGIGFAVLSVPVLSLVDPALAPVPQLLLSLPLTVSMAYRERSAIHLGSMVWVLAGRFPGAFLGSFLLGIASAQMLDLMIGAVVIGGTLIFSTNLKVRRTPLTQLTAGVVSGVTGLISAIGGPPVALLYRDARGAELRANLAAIFALGVIISIVTRALGSQISEKDLILTAVLFPALVLGLFLSGSLTKYFEGSRLKTAVLLLCGFAGVGLIFRSFLRAA